MFLNFILKLNSAGSNLIFSTLVGGSQFENGLDIEIDSNMNVYVTGETSSTDFPITENHIKAEDGGAGDGFLVKLTSDGSELLFSTFLGSGTTDKLNDLELDSNGYIYLVGETYSFDPVEDACGCYGPDMTLKHDDVFLIVLDQSSPKIEYYIVLGAHSPN